jgi:hypothetical protein
MAAPGTSWGMSPSKWLVSLGAFGLAGCGAGGGLADTFAVFTGSPDQAAASFEGLMTAFSGGFDSQVLTAESSTDTTYRSATIESATNVQRAGQGVNETIDCPFGGTITAEGEIDMGNTSDLLAGELTANMDLVAALERCAVSEDLVTGGEVDYMFEMAANSATSALFFTWTFGGYITVEGVDGECPLDVEVHGTGSFNQAGVQADTVVFGTVCGEYDAAELLEDVDLTGEDDPAGDDDPAPTAP